MDGASFLRVPLYQRVFNTLKERISSGLYAPGFFIPSERELCGEFGVHRVTVRKSLDMLVADALVEKLAGRGTRVREPRADAAGEGEAGAAQEASPAADNAGTLPGPPPEQKYIVFILCADALRRDRFTEPFQAGLFYHLERRSAQLGYHLIYKTVNSCGCIADIVKSVKASGIIFSSLVFDCLLEEAHALGVPSLIVNHNDPRFTSIQCDNFASAREMTSYLIATGHRSIAVLTGRANYETSRERLAGFRASLRKHSLDYAHMPVYEGDWTFDCGYETGKKIAALGKKKRPGAVFAFNDESAFGLIKALQEKGVAVPGEISVAGFDDTPACSRTSPALSTVHVDIETMATAVIQQLYFALELSMKIEPVIIRVPARLVIRDSIKKRKN
jgi:LacI family transcriptional regulator